jgi:Cyclic nucleotide-binding domain
MQRKLVTLSKDTVLWEAGDIARNFAVLEKGKLAARSGGGLVGILWPQMVLGESALFAGDDRIERRTATVAALEDGTAVAEYPASVVRDALAEGDDALPRQILTTLVGQICRNLLMVVAAKRAYPFIDDPLRGLVQGIVEDAQKAQPIRSWDNFLLTARFLFELREVSDRTLESLGPDASQRSEMVQDASSLLSQLFQGREIVPVLEGFLKAEKEKTQWWARGMA